MFVAEIPLPITKRLCLSRSGSTYREYFSVEIDSFAISFPKIIAITPIAEIPIIKIIEYEFKLHSKKYQRSFCY